MKATTAGMSIPIVLRLLRCLTRLIPPIPHASGLSNRLIKPLACRLSRPGKVLANIWSIHGGVISMHVYPCEVVGGNLFFIPQLYGRWERRFLAENLPEGGVFVDVGGNIGAYTLWAAACMGPQSRIAVFEADRENYDLLCENIQANEFVGMVEPLHVGISDREEVLSLSLNQNGNSGANSFSVVGAHFEEVACVPLCQALKSVSLDRVDVLKVDIEGFELRVLRRFFIDIAHTPDLAPRYLLIEIAGGPMSTEEKRELHNLIIANGYQCVRVGENSLFRRCAASASS